MKESTVRDFKSKVEQEVENAKKRKKRCKKINVKVFSPYSLTINARRTGQYGTNLHQSMKPLRRATRMLLVILALILQAGQKNSFQKNGICQTHENVFKGNDSGGGKKEIGVAVP